MEMQSQVGPTTEFTNIASGEVLTELRPIIVKFEAAPTGHQSNVLNIELNGASYKHSLETQNSTHFVVNPYALENGPYNLKAFTSHNPSAQAELTFLVNISGNLSSSIQNYLTERKTPAITFDGLDSTVFDYDSQPLPPWFDQPNYKDYLSEYKKQGLNDQEIRALSDFCEQGYCVLPVTLEEDLIKQAALDLEAAETEGYQGITKGSSQRMELMHEKFESIRKIWCHPEILRFLELIYKDKVSPCQTLCFMNGSQQLLHQDGLYLTSFPSGYMCGVWIALEDVIEGAGQLSVVPGSHKMYRPYRNSIEEKVMTPLRYEEIVIQDLYAQIKEKGLEVKPYLPKKGQILIWHERLVHGGSPRTIMNQTRKSFVAHYYAKGCIAYYDSSRNLANKHSI